MGREGADVGGADAVAAASVRGVVTAAARSADRLESWRIRLPQGPGRRGAAVPVAVSGAGVGFRYIWVNDAVAAASSASMLESRRIRLPQGPRPAAVAVSWAGLGSRRIRVDGGFAVVFEGRRGKGWGGCARPSVTGVTCNGVWMEPLVMSLSVYPGVGVICDSFV